jgi:hypothetical protein
MEARGPAHIDVQQDFTLPGAPAKIPSAVEALPHDAPVGPRLSGGETDPTSNVVRLYLSDGST